MRRKWLMLCGVIAVLAIAAWVFLPFVQREMMRAPFMDGMSALRRGDDAGLRAVFTDDAVVHTGVLNLRIPVDTVIDAAQTVIEREPLDGSVRFGGFGRVMSRSGREVAVDFIIKVNIESDDLPYKNAPPIKRTGQAVLRRQGWFAWKIREITIPEGELQEFLHDMMRERLPAGVELPSR